MKSNTFQTLLNFLVTLLFFIGCQKGGFVNLTSTISLENYDLRAMEGEYLTFDISLTDELSEDLPLNIEIIRDIEKGRYINFDDFHDYYEYSTDSGKNWKRVRTLRVIIPERSKNIKIRLSTIDDHKLEIDEEFAMKISPKTGSIFKIS